MIKSKKTPGEARHNHDVDTNVEYVYRLIPSIIIQKRIVCTQVVYGRVNMGEKD